MPAPEAPVVVLRPSSDPAPWGRVAEDGTAFVRTAEGEREVGSFPGASPEEALAYFGRKYDELVAQADLLEQRLTGAEVREVPQQVARLREQVAQAHAIGDLDGLVARLDALEAVAKERRAEADRERQRQREAHIAARTALVEEAERLAATEPDRMQWKAAGDRLKELFEQWQAAQKGEGRLDRRSEDALWKRFSHARTAFDRKRRAWFSELEERRTDVKAVKEAVVREAEALSTSTEWGATAAEYRRLMDRWKAAGRVSKKDDDALWVRFRAAQDAFFAARSAASAEATAAERANLEVKEALLAEAEAILPVTDPAAAREALRRVQERWDAAGRVPRGDLGRLEGRMRAVETAVRDAEQSRWRRTNPEARARAEGVASQLESAIAQLEQQRADAEARGDSRRVREAEEALAARRSWLEQAQRALTDFSG